MNRISIIYRRSYLYWRGKAGALAKHKKGNLRIANEQALRYFEKYANASGFKKEYPDAYYRIKKNLSFYVDLSHK